MITIEGPVVETVHSDQGKSFSMELGCMHGDFIERIPQVAIDYMCDSIENIVYNGNICTCDVISSQEADILLDVNYNQV